MDPQGTDLQPKRPAVKGSKTTLSNTMTEFIEVGICRFTVTYGLDHDVQPYLDE
jgi:hypothetical protein